MKVIFYILTLFFLNFCQGQNPQLLDSLLQVQIANNFAHDTLRVKNYLALTASYYPINKDSAAYYNQLAHDLASQINYRTAALRALNNIGVFHFEKGKYDEAETIYQQVLEEALKDENPRTEMFANWNLGNIENTRGNYEAALEYCIRAADIAQREGEMSILAQLYINMSIFSDELGLDQERRRYAIKAKNVSSKIDNNYALANAYSILANSYFNDNLDSVKYYFLQADSIVKNQRMPAIEWEIHSGLGHVALQQNQLVEALNHFKISQNVSNSFQTHTQIFRTSCDLARVFVQLDMQDSAEFYFDNFLRLTDSVGQVHFKNACIQDLIKFYEQTGRYNKATVLYRELLNSMDSSFNQEVKIAVLDLERKYQIAEKERELLEQRLIVDERTRQRNGLLFIAGFLGSLILFVYLFQRQRIRKNKLITTQEHKLQSKKIQQLENEKKLLAMSSMIEGQEAERIRIARDLHDGLGGLLSSLKAHFNTIQREIEELESVNVYQKVNSLIDTASSEVRRISHNMVPHALQMLGLNDALKDFCIPAQSDQTNVHYEWSGSEERFAEDKEIMLYRIAQELLNNAIKYAQAQNILVQINRFDHELNLIVEDDGIGFDFDSAIKSGGLGLKSVQSRISYLKGTMDIDSKPGEGTSISIQVPLKSGSD